MKEQRKNMQFFKALFFLQIFENYGYMPEPAFEFLSFLIFENYDCES